MIIPTTETRTAQPEKDGEDENSIMADKNLKERLIPLLQFISFTKRPPFASYLDVGCYNGGLSMKVAAEFGSVLTGLDLVNLSKNRFSFIQFDLEHVNELNIDKKFDLITIISTLHHVKNKSGLFSFVSRILNQNGLLIVSGHF